MDLISAQMHILVPKYRINVFGNIGDDFVGEI